MKASGLEMRNFLTSSRLPIVALAAIIVLAAAGVGIWAATGGSGAPHSATTTTTSTRTGTATPSHRTYALLYLAAIVRKSRITILKQWPSRIYQHYTSGSQVCYEWWDKPIALYNLCFENGLLTDKAVE